MEQMSSALQSGRGLRVITRIFSLPWRGSPSKESSHNPACDSVKSGGVLSVRGSFLLRFCDRFGGCDGVSVGAGRWAGYKVKR